MTNVKENLAKLRAYALTAKTAIYNEDAMTAIELSAATACKVNECVEAINLIIETVDNIVYFVEYDESSETLKV